MSWWNCVSEMVRPAVVGSAPGAVSLPGEEGFDVVGAVELVESAHVGVVGCKPVAQHHDGLDARVDAAALEGGGQGVGVADDVAADGGLGDALGELGWGVSHASLAAARPGGEAELIARFGECEQPA